MCLSQIVLIIINFIPNHKGKCIFWTLKKNIRQQVSFCIFFILWIVYCSLAQGQINTSVAWLYCTSLSSLKNLYPLKIIISNFSFCFYFNISFWWHEEICIIYISAWNMYQSLACLSEIYAPMNRPAGISMRERFH